MEQTCYYHEYTWNFTYQSTHTLSYKAYNIQTNETNCIQLLQTHHTHQNKQNRHTCTHQTKHETYIYYSSHSIPEHQEDCQTKQQHIGSITNYRMSSYPNSMNSRQINHNSFHHTCTKSMFHRIHHKYVPFVTHKYLTPHIYSLVLDAGC